MQNTNALSRSQTSALVSQWLKETSGYFLRPLTVIRGFSIATIRPDLMAGLTVGIVMLPQAIAYALVAELPPETGLYAAIVATVVGALWGSSIHLNTGPSNAASLLVLSTLLPLIPPYLDDGSSNPEYLGAAAVMAILVGLIRLLMGIARLGVLVNFVSDSVIIGFTAGAGILISVNQLRHLLNLPVASMPGFIDTLIAIVTNIGYTHWPSFLLGCGTIIVVLLLKKYLPQVPAPLLSMILASTVVGFFQLDQQGVLVLGELPRTLPPFVLPTFDAELVNQMAVGVLAVSAIGLVEAMSIARSIATQSGQRIDSNQEFVGQGLSSIAVGLFSGYTCSGSFVRSAVNYASGAVSPLSHIFSASFVLLALFMFAPYAAYLPRTALAGVLMVTAYGMVNRTEMARIWNASLGDSGIMIATILATLLLPLQYAVLAGIVVSIIRYLLKSSTPRVTAVVPDPDFRHFVELEDQPHCPQLGVISVSGSLYFGATQHVENVIRANLEAHPEQRYLLLRMNSVDQCDVSGIHMLESVVRMYRERGGDIYIGRTQPQVRQQMESIGFDKLLGPAHFLDGSKAIAHLFHKVLEPSVCIYECPVRVFAECQALPKQNYQLSITSTAQLVEHEVPMWRPSELLAELKQEEIVLIDVRENSEYRRGHIAQAQLMPIRHIRQRGSTLSQGKPIVLVCRIGRRSRLAAIILMDLGYENVSHLEGGVLGWEAAGYPLAVE